MTPLTRRRKASELALFVDRVNIGPDCWEWTGTKNYQGYGRFRESNERAHRAAWRLLVGPIPEDSCVLHRCGNSSCVRPSHLYLGTPADNARDAIILGELACGDRNGSRVHPESRPRGERFPQSKLTEDNVREIRRRAALGESCCALGRAFNVHNGTVWKVVNGKGWTHVR